MIIKRFLKFNDNFFFQENNFYFFEHVKQLIDQKNEFRIKFVKKQIKFHFKRIKLITSIAFTIFIFINKIQNVEHVLKIFVKVRFFITFKIDVFKNVVIDKCNENFDSFQFIKLSIDVITQFVENLKFS